MVKPACVILFRNLMEQHSERTSKPDFFLKWTISFTFFQRKHKPHGFGRHALCDLIGGEQQLHGPDGAAHHRRGEGVGEQVGSGALPEQVDERLRTNSVAA